MLKYFWVLIIGLLLALGGSCGDDGSDDNGGGSDGDSDGDADGDADGDSDGDSDGDTDEGVAGADACEGFMTVAFERVRECGGPIAVILEDVDDEQIPTFCSSFCATLDDAVIEQSAYDACVEFVEDAECLAEGDTETSEFIPLDCKFIEDDLECDFPFPT